MEVRDSYPTLTFGLEFNYRLAGQGTWFLLTHHPDKIIAAAPVSGYSSIDSTEPPFLLEHTVPSGR